MTIRSRTYPYNMASWLAEKSEHACESLCRIAEQLKKADMPDEAREAVLNELHGPLYDVTKIIQYAYDTEIPAWDPHVAQRMLDQGVQGYKNFMAKVKEYSDMEVFESFKND